MTTIVCDGVGGKRSKLTDIAPFDDPDGIAGQGTVGMEIVSQHPDPIRAVFVPMKPVAVWRRAWRHLSSRSAPKSKKLSAFRPTIPAV